MAERKYLRRQIYRSNLRSRCERPALNGLVQAVLRSALPKAEHDAADWQVAMETLLLVAERDGPEMLARIAVMKALNRNGPR